MATEPTHNSPIIAVPLSQILDNPYQYRSHYDAEHILKLAASIKSYKNQLKVTQGLQQIPLARLVFLDSRSGETRMLERGHYAGDRPASLLTDNPGAKAQLLFGHSRMRAFELIREGLRSLLKYGGSSLGFDLNTVPYVELENTYAALWEPDLDYATMPLMLTFADDRSMWAHSVTENSQRKNVTPIDEAKSLQRAMEEFGLSTEAAAAPFGWARSTAANKLRLLELPSDVQKQIAGGELSERHGRELLRVAADPERVRKLAKMAVDKQLPVRRLGESVDWEERALKEAQEKARQLELTHTALAQGLKTPADQVMPPDRLRSEANWAWEWFDQEVDQDRILIEQNGCGPHCPCFCLSWKEYGVDRAYRPDPGQMPNVCFVCTDRDAYRAQRAALGSATDNEELLAAAAERKRQIDERNGAAWELWQRWLKEQDRQGLWNSMAFWREMTSSMLYNLGAIIKEADDVPVACDKLLHAIYADTRTYDRELGGYVHDRDVVSGLIKRLSRAVSRETKRKGAA